jgi:hypothetical protein
MFTVPIGSDQEPAPWVNWRLKKIKRDYQSKAVKKTEGICTWCILTADNQQPTVWSRGNVLDPYSGDA